MINYKPFEYFFNFAILSSLILPVYYSYCLILFALLLYLIISPLARIFSLNFFSSPIILLPSLLIIFFYRSGLSFYAWFIFEVTVIFGVSLYLRYSSIPQSGLFKNFIFAIFLILFYYYCDGQLGYNHSINIFNGSSNLISGSLLILVTCYSYFKFAETCKFSFFSPIALLALSVFLTGRSGIIFSIILLSLNFIFFIIANKKLYNPLFIFTLFAFLLLGGLSFSFEYLIINTRLAYGFDPGLRSNLFFEYFNFDDFASFFWGGSYPSSNLYEDNGNNPHNSFLRAHYFFGVFFLFSFLILIVNRIRSDWVMFSSRPRFIFYYKYFLLLIILSRSCLDSLFFPSVFDVFFFLLLCHNRFDKSMNFYKV